MQQKRGDNSRLFDTADNVTRRSLDSNHHGTTVRASAPVTTGTTFKFPVHPDNFLKQRYDVRTVTSMGGWMIKYLSSD